jgi:hypothetical protein
MGQPLLVYSVMKLVKKSPAHMVTNLNLGSQKNVPYFTIQKYHNNA